MTVMLWVVAALDAVVLAVLYRRVARWDRAQEEMDRWNTR